VTHPLGGKEISIHYSYPLLGRPKKRKEKKRGRRKIEISSPILPGLGRTKREWGEGKRPTCACRLKKVVTSGLFYHHQGRREK